MSGINVQLPTVQEEEEPTVEEVELTIPEKIARLRLKITPATVEMYDHFDCNTRNIGRLSDNLWREIVTYAADARGVLSVAQQRRVIGWAQDRAHLIAEKELSGKGRSVQIWNVLDNMGCLAYDMEV